MEFGNEIDGIFIKLEEQQYFFISDNDSDEEMEIQPSLEIITFDENEIKQEPSEDNDTNYAITSHSSKNHIPEIVKSDKTSQKKAKTKTKKVKTGSTNDKPKKVDTIYDIDLVYPCKICLCKFASESDLYVHTYRKKCSPPGTIPCPECGEFISKSDLKLHKSCHGSQFKCSRCNTGYKAYSDLQKHKKRVHPGLNYITLRNGLGVVSEPLFCALCSFSSNFRSGLELHVRKKHGIDLVKGERILKNIPRKGMFHCDLCHGSFFTNCGLDQHVSNSHRGFKDRIRMDIEVSNSNPPIEEATLKPSDELDTRIKTETDNISTKVKKEIIDNTSAEPDSTASKMESTLCDSCGEFFTPEVEDSLKNESNCPQCTQNEGEILRYEMHVNKSTRPPSTRWVADYECILCKEVCPTTHSFVQHSKISHGIADSDNMIIKTKYVTTAPPLLSKDQTSNETEIDSDDERFLDEVEREERVE